MTSDRMTMQASPALASATCPGCEAPVKLSASTRPNEIVDCAECASELEVVSVDPLMLAIAPEVEEDWGE